MVARGPSRAPWGLAVLSVLATVLVLELFVRVFPPTPRTQVVRGHGLRLLDGEPVWGDESRTNRACADLHPERTRILFFGSSITWGSGVDDDEAFTVGLEQRLNELRPAPGFCVLNFAQPAFQMQQKAAVARVEIPRYRPALVLWESWAEWRRFHMLGGAAFSVSDFHVRPDGFIGIAGVPDGVNRTLFTYSHLYQYVALAFAEPSRALDLEEETIFRLTPELRAIIDLERAAGGKFSVYFAPPLDRPFRETAEAPPHGRAVWEAFLRTEGVPSLGLANALIDRDYLSLRHDPCCHFNAAGHRALVDVMTRVVLEQLGPD